MSDFKKQNSFYDQDNIDSAWSVLQRLASANRIDLPCCDWQQVLADPTHEGYWYVCLLMVCGQWLQQIKASNSRLLRLERVKQQQQLFPLLTKPFPSIALVQCSYADADEPINSMLAKNRGHCYLPPGCGLRMQNTSDIDIAVTTCLGVQIFPIGLLNFRAFSGAVLKNSDADSYTSAVDLTENHQAEVFKINTTDNYINNEKYYRPNHDPFLYTENINDHHDSVTGSDNAICFDFACFSEGFFDFIIEHGGASVAPEHKLLPLNLYLAQGKCYRELLYVLLTQHVTAIYLDMSWAKELLNDTTQTIIPLSQREHIKSQLNDCLGERYYLGGGSLLTGSNSVFMPIPEHFSDNSFHALRYYNYGQYSSKEPQLFLQANIWNSKVWSRYYDALLKFGELSELWRKLKQQSLQETYNKLCFNGDAGFDAIAEAIPWTISLTIQTDPVRSYGEEFSFKKNLDGCRNDSCKNKLLSPSSALYIVNPYGRQQQDHFDNSISSSVITDTCDEFLSPNKKFTNSINDKHNLYKQVTKNSDLEAAARIDLTTLSKEDFDPDDEWSSMCDPYLIPKLQAAPPDSWRQTATSSSQSQALPPGMRQPDAVCISRAKELRKLLKCFPWLPKITADYIELNIVPVTDLHQISMQPVADVQANSEIVLSVSHAAECGMNKAEELIWQVSSVKEIYHEDLNLFNDATGDINGATSVNDKNMATNNNHSNHIKEVIASEQYFANDDKFNNQNPYSSKNSPQNYITDVYYQCFYLRGDQHMLLTMPFDGDAPCCEAAAAPQSLGRDIQNDKINWFLSLSPDDAFIDKRTQLSVTGLGIYSQGLGPLWNSGVGYLLSMPENNNYSSAVAPLDSFYSVVRYEKPTKKHIPTAASMLDENKKSLRFTIFPAATSAIDPILSRTDKDFICIPLLQKNALLTPKDCILAWKIVQSDVQRFSSDLWCKPALLLSILDADSSWINLQGTVYWLWSLTWVYSAKDFIPESELNVGDSVYLYKNKTSHKAYIIFYNFMQHLSRFIDMPVVLVARVFLAGCGEALPDNFFSHKPNRLLWSYSSH